VHGMYVLYMQLYIFGSAIVYLYKPNMCLHIYQRKRSNTAMEGKVP
jgi:hypothetical protein